MQHVDRQIDGKFQVVAQAAEVGGDGQLDARDGFAQPGVGAPVAVRLGGGQVENQCRLVQLELGGAGGGQVGQPVGVGRQHGVQQVDGVAAVGPLGQPQEGERPDHHRTGDDAQRERLPELCHGCLRRVAEHLVSAQFGNQVVVVGVEPLGQFEGGDAVAAARHREVAGERVGVGIGHVERRAEPLGDGAQRDRGVEHLVVVGEVATRDVVDALGLLQPPVGGAQPGGDAGEAGGVQVAAPVLLQRPLEFAVASDAGESEVRGGDGHASALRGAGADESIAGIAVSFFGPHPSWSVAVRTPQPVSWLVDRTPPPAFPDHSSGMDGRSALHSQLRGQPRIRTGFPFTAAAPIEPRGRRRTQARRVRVHDPAVSLVWTYFSPAGEGRNLSRPAVGVAGLVIGVVSVVRAPPAGATACRPVGRRRHSRRRGRRRPFRWSPRRAGTGRGAGRRRSGCRAPRRCRRTSSRSARAARSG